MQADLATELSRALSFVDVLSARAVHQADRIAYRFLASGEAETARLTYGELDREARRIGGRLQRLAEPGARVLLLYPPGLEFVAAFFGCLYGGMIAVPAYPPGGRKRAPQRLIAIAGDSGATVAATIAARRPALEAATANLPAFEGLSWLATDEDPGSGEEEVWTAPGLGRDNLALLQYTSGSTGTPKGVMVSHGNLLANSEFIRLALGCSTRSVSVTWLPSFHDMGLVDGVLQPTYTGFPGIILPPMAFLQRPARWLEAISRYGGTHGGSPSFGYDLCVRKTAPAERELLDLSTWENAYNGAEPIRAEVIERFCEAFQPSGFQSRFMYPCYGLAEGTLIASGGGMTEEPVYLDVDAAALERHRAVPAGPETPVRRRLVGSGRPWIDSRVVIVDPETCRESPAGEIGEIWIAGSSVAQGYWLRPEATEETFGARLAGKEDAGRFLRSGDLGFLQGGELFVTGRIKDLLILRGRNLYPQDVELTAERSHPALRPGCAAAFTVEVDGEESLAVACEVDRTAQTRLAAGGEGIEEIAAAMRQAVAEEHDVLVETVLLLDVGTIPKTSSGKIQRHACRKGFLAGSLSLAGESRRRGGLPAAEADPVSGSVRGAADIPLRLWLTGRIAQLLKVPPGEIDPSQPLARYGFDSLRAVSLSAELQERLGRPVSPTVAYEHPTIDGLVELLEGGGDLALPDAAAPVPEAAEEGTEAAAIAAIAAIAVVGLACRFPGAPDSDAFWRLLEEGRDVITEVPAGRWDAGSLYDPRPQVPGKSRSRWGGFVDGIDLFDAELFGIAPREAEAMDPQQRLLLEVTWEALEHAGIAPRRIAGTDTGVFVGISSFDYFRRCLPGAEAVSLYTGTGNALSIAANRLSYQLDLRGPSFAVDTACSSALTAVHLACRALRRGECGMAVAAGVNALLDPVLTVAFSQGNLMSGDGRCKTFDESADGYVRGEGCGAVLLKRLADAERDGDRVLAVIRGTAVNQDGRSNGLTAPSGAAQQAVIRAALADAGVRPGEIGYVEAHGTGTPLGDPIEMAALQAVLGEGRPAESRCWVGSVKTNIGHLEAAAGIAGLIKAVLSLHHGRIPAHLHLRRPNPHLRLAGTAFAVPTAAVDWPEGRRLAGVSSFGFGGANAHVIVEAAPVLPEVAPASDPRPAHLLALSARDDRALAELAQRWAAFLESHPDAPLADVCAGAAIGREALDERLAVVSGSVEDLRRQLARIARRPEAAGALRARARREPARVAFLFTGQGAQWAGMGRQLYGAEPVFRTALDRCAELLRADLDRPLNEILFSEEDAGLQQTAVAQPALFALEWALAEQWRAWGVVPAAVFGHSVGEITAACVAGVIGLEDAVRLVAERARLMGELPEGGGMLVVRSDAARVEAALAGFDGLLSIAAYNAPREVVLSGSRDALQTVAGILAGEGIQTRELPVSHAFHSLLVEPMLDGFGRVLEGITFAAPRLPVISGLTGRPAGDEIATAGYWLRQCREPVRFVDGLSSLLGLGFESFLEIGPQPALLALGRQIEEAVPAAGRRLWLPSLRRGRPEAAQMLESLGALWTDGSVRGLAGLYGGARRPRLDLPTYPFQRRRYWTAAAGPALDRLRRGTAADVEELALRLAEEGGLGPARREGIAEVLTALVALDRKAAGASADPIPAATGSSLYQVEWRPAERRTAASAAGEGWLIVAQKDAAAARVSSALAARGRRVVMAFVGERTNLAGPAGSGWSVDPRRAEDFRLLLARSLEEGPIEGVLFLAGGEGGNGADPSPFDAALSSGAAALHLAQALHAAQLSERPRLWLATRGAVPAGGRMLPESLPHAALWGLGSVLAQEATELWGGLIDLDPEALDPAALAEELLAPDGEDHLALRGGERWVARLVPAAQTIVPGRSLGVRQDGLYLITGGLGEVGLAVAGRLAESGAGSLLLAGRRDPDEAQRAAIRRLEEHGVRVETAAVDVSDKEAVRRLFQRIDEIGLPLRGVIHAAGVLDDATLPRQSWERLEAVMAPKVAGAVHLHLATLDRPLDFFILFSSVAAVLGSVGQANYAAANAVLGALAHLRRSRGLPASTIDWGPWEGIGLARTGGALQRFAALGLHPLEPHQALDALAAITSLGTEGPAQAAVLRLDVGAVRRGVAARLSLLRDLTGQGAAAHGPVESAVLAVVRKTPAGRREQVIAEFLREQVRDVLRLHPAARLDPGRGFFDLGMDSLMAVELKNRIETELGLTLVVSCVFDHPTIGALAAFLGGKLAGAAEAAERREPAEEPAAATLAGADLAAAIESELGRIESLL